MIENTKLGWIAVSLVVFVVAIAVLELGCGLVTLSIDRLTGPPTVRLKETYQEKPGGPEFDHAAFDQVLQTHVDKDGWVDYEKLQNDPALLDTYILQLEKVEIEKFGRSERLAILINAYNAFTLKLILEHYPIDSIKSIPTSRRWDDQRWNVGGALYSLNDLEHQQIRPNFKEPRIHFALVCAAVGCPPLRNEAFTGQKLEAQLEAQTRYVHSHATWLVFDSQAKRLHLTKLYDWYGNDFEQVADSIPSYVSAYSASLKRSLDEGGTPQIRWLKYDWSLNDVENKVDR